VLREIDVTDLAKAMKGTDDEVQDKIYRNMSRRAAILLKEEIEYMGPVRKGDVMESREKIVTTILELEERGEITILRSGDDEMLV
jgi:flagellar motor switch protein FliG